LKLTKVGYGSEPEPRKIILTPEFFDYEKFMKEDTISQFNQINNQGITSSEKMVLGMRRTESKNSLSLLAYKKNIQELKFQIESFVYNIIYNILQLKKQQRDKNYNCILCIDFTLERIMKDIYGFIIKSFLENALIISVRLIPKTISPIFTSGYSSGIIIDVGYMFTTISAINNGYPFKPEIVSIGSLELERFLKRAIVEENIINSKKKIKNPEAFQNGIIKFLNDLVVKCAICVNKKISTLLEDPSEELKLKTELDHSKVDSCKDLQDFYISFLTRVNLGEKLFGNIESDEINIAYSLLKVIKTINCEDRKKLCQNIILSGGTSMIIGFYRRLIEEINYWIESEHFEDIKKLQNYIKIHKIILPRNCLTWIGASLISGIEKINIKQLSITKEEFDSLSDPVGKIFSFFKF
jgi:hypothetical protein